ncbi:NADH-quinone oxidoreductase subunit E [Qingshengfaniella alkalisoli]|uniref:NADH-quinone oxidoreductase subunit E n=1 Tax=Qingshengfaniella alkalisoli TaxID=2599296 RepID=A0A5B8I5T3_9RHOB|nr:NADH-quinone oxidoreductase subunit E [Qingshengfaniella alkalisoli]QDY68749.1 NADH-quinone oxidoreductase subunit E [Qingshengfaniella alkalisoli]
MLRRLHLEQPESFEFTPDNRKWAEAQMTKYPEGRQASAIIALLWRAQEQEGWLTRPAIEHVADMLGLAYIRALEVATFYFMFQLQPVGSVAHFQICGTTTCMICGAEDLMEVCKQKIAPKAHQLSDDGKFSWEEVECLGACANAPMAQIGKDYYEDLTADGLSLLIDDMAAGKVPTPGPQNGRYASEPANGLTSLEEYSKNRAEDNASVALAKSIGDTLKRIDGSEVPITTPWLGAQDRGEVEKGSGKDNADRAEGQPVDETGVTKQEAPALKKGTPATEEVADSRNRPEGLEAPREGSADDLKKIKGVGPKLEALLNRLGFYHFDQIARWNADEIAWVDENLEGFKGRVSRDEWVVQAKTLAAGGETEFSKKVDEGDIY